MSGMPRYGRCGVPALGLGTAGLHGDGGVAAVAAALRCGYRLVDTAAAYGNEAVVGRGLIASGLPRPALFVIVKVPPKACGSPAALRQSVTASIERLGIQYADLVLLHWPGVCKEKKANSDNNNKNNKNNKNNEEERGGLPAARRRAFDALRALQADGLVRWLGVSNFLPRHLADLFDDDNENGDGDGDNGDDNNNNNNNNKKSKKKKLSERMDLPVLNQVELHPRCVQRDVVAYDGAHGVVTQQYAALGGKEAEALLSLPALQAVAAEVFPRFSVAEVLLMWGLAQGFSTLVRSSNAEHLAANWRAGLAVFSQETENGKGLTAHQREVLRTLRARIGLEGTEDHHFCWFSSEVP